MKFDMSKITVFFNLTFDSERNVSRNCKQNDYKERFL